MAALGSPRSTTTISHGSGAGMCRGPLRPPLRPIIGNSSTSSGWSRRGCHSQSMSSRG